MSRIVQGCIGAMSAVVVTVLALGSACHNEDVPCQVDTDCPQGTICREGQCGPTGGDAAVPPDVVQPPACRLEGEMCSFPGDCCSNVCTDSRCASSTPQPPPNCRSALELCQNDCCDGLTCTNGVCR